MARPVTPADFEAEEEVDLARYGSAIAARWWLAVLGLLAGALIGYVLALGGSDVYRANALVDLGSPQGPTGGTVQNPGSMVTQGREVARSEAVVRRAASEVGMRPARLRSGLSVQPVSQAGRAAATTLLGITVQGESPRQVQRAANAIAEGVVAEVSPYVEDKIRLLEAQIAAIERDLEAAQRNVDAAVGASSADDASAIERLIASNQAVAFEQRRATLQDTLFRRQADLSLAQNVEQPRLVDRATAVRTTARSPRNSAVVGAVLGLLAGLAAALAWQPVSAAAARRRV